LLIYVFFKGFLSFDTDDVPGNAGIFDQIEALRWVNKYVEYFGGDPSQITIAGESAGSASVTLLLLAPQTRGFNPVPTLYWKSTTLFSIVCDRTIPACHW
jgi:acetyl esterase/lipase